jgi:hypothetical protein
LASPRAILYYQVVGSGGHNHLLFMSSDFLKTVKKNFFFLRERDWVVYNIGSIPSNNKMYFGYNNNKNNIKLIKMRTIVGPRTLSLI